MDASEHGTFATNGITMRYVSHGSGPLVLFCHGFPESWYSWRYQLPAVADAGYRAVALDMRGYGGTSKPNDLNAYSLSHLIGDVVGAVGALGESQAVIVGHDWGGPVAWYSALMRPDIFRAIAALSAPYQPPVGALSDGRTLEGIMAATYAGQGYYRMFFQEPGVAEADFEADVACSMAGFLYAISGDIVADGIAERCWDGTFPADQTVSQQLITPKQLPAWLSQTDLDFYVAEATTNGFRGGLNWYRNMNALPAILSPFVGATIRQPAFYQAGSLDVIAGNTPKAIDTMQRSVPDLRHCELIAGAGHWLQQERHTAVNDALITFLNGL
ncbi:MAG: alpha/beta fold hydrolase [Acidimicrobiales bacterium]